MEAVNFITVTASTGPHAALAKGGGFRASCSSARGDLSILARFSVSEAGVIRAESPAQRHRHVRGLDVDRTWDSMQQSWWWDLCRALRGKRDRGFCALPILLELRRHEQKLLPSKSFPRLSNLRSLGRQVERDFDRHRRFGRHFHEHDSSMGADYQLSFGNISVPSGNRAWDCTRGYHRGCGGYSSETRPRENR